MTTKLNREDLMTAMLDMLIENTTNNGEALEILACLPTSYVISEFLGNETIEEKDKSSMAAIAGNYILNMTQEAFRQGIEHLEDTTGFIAQTK